MERAPCLRKLLAVLVKAFFLTVSFSGLVLAIASRNAGADSGHTATITSGSHYIVRGDDAAYALVLQPDRKIVVAGSSWNNASMSNGFAVARYNPDGSLDPGFGQGGKVMTELSPGDDTGRALTLQPDGKVVVAGVSYNGRSMDSTLIRYNHDGSLDSDFGSRGKVTTNIGPGDDYVHAVMLQGDKKIVLAGYSSQESNPSLVLLRYNLDGSLDPTFGTDGTVTIISGTTLLAVEADGKIIVARSSSGGGNAALTLTRYNPNGTLDPSFGSISKVTPLLSPGSRNSVIALQDDGKIVAAGMTEGGFTLTRYNRDGSLEASFGTDGRVTTHIGTDSVVTALALQDDGKIVVAGYSALENFDYSFVLVRYKQDGSVDTSFGSDGIVITSIGIDSRPAALTLQADGKIVAAGSASQGTGFDQGVDSDFTLVRYNPDGSVDQHFGRDGLVTTNFYSVRLDPDRCSDTPVPPRSGMLLGGKRVRLLFFGDIVAALALQPDNKILAAGSSDRGFALARYSSDSSLDTSFGQGGKVTVRVGTYDKQPDEALSVAVQTDGKITVVGRSWIDNPLGPDGDHFVLLRYHADGSLDTSFGTGGKIATSIGADGAIYSFALQSDGKFITAGQARVSVASASPQPLPPVSGSLLGADFSGGDPILHRSRRPSDQSSVGVTLTRYHPDGSLDQRFGEGGQVIIDFDPGNDGAYLLALQRDEKIVVARIIRKGPDSEFVLTRYHPDGSLDQSFGTDGKAVIPLDLEQTSLYKVFALALQSDDKIVVAGTEAGKLVLVRYCLDGSRDATFGVDGKVSISPSTNSDVVRALIFQEDQKIVVAGSCSNGLGSIFALSRYHSDGSLDPTFGSGGKVTTRIGSGYTAQ